MNKKHILHLELKESEAWDVIVPVRWGEEDSFRRLYVCEETAKRFMMGRFESNNFFESPTVVFTFKDDELAHCKVIQFFPPMHEEGSEELFTLLLDLDTFKRIEPDDNSWSIKRQNIDDAQGRSEKAMAEYWKAQNDVHTNGSLNFGKGSIQDMMLSVQRYDGPKDFSPMLSNRERKIVATFVQWMTTNCGRGFVEEAFNAAGFYVRIDRKDFVDGMKKSLDK